MYAVARAIHVAVQATMRGVLVVVPMYQAPPATASVCLVLRFASICQVGVPQAVDD